MDIFPPPGIPEEEERIELAIAARAGDIFEETGLFILCAAFDRPENSQELDRALGRERAQRRD